MKCSSASFGTLLVATCTYFEVLVRHAPWTATRQQFILLILLLVFLLSCTAHIAAVMVLHLRDCCSRVGGASGVDLLQRILLVGLGVGSHWGVGRRLHSIGWDVLFSRRHCRTGNLVGVGALRSVCSLEKCLAKA